MHWPVAFVADRGLFPAHPSKDDCIYIDPDTSVVDTWKAMIALPKTKVCRAFLLIAKGDAEVCRQVKSIGVSNFTIEHLEAIIKATGVVPVSRRDAGKKAC
jgi:L-glyceraldehyde reductase